MAAWLVAGALWWAVSPATRATDLPNSSQPAPRIVSLSPHITELLYAAGAGDRLVGVDDASDFPAAAARLPRLGEPAALDVEKLLNLRPSLVIVWETGTPPGVRAQLERLRLRVLVTEQHRLDDIGETLLAFGRVAGTLPTATEAAHRYRSELGALRARYAGRRRLSVFYQVWDHPLYTLSGSQIVTEILSLCGGDNVFASLPTPAPMVDREAVLARNPDVLLIAATGTPGALQAAQWRRFSGLSAVRRGAVFLINPSLLGRMSPRMLTGAESLCEALDEARMLADRRQ